MAILDSTKGKTSVKELVELPNRIFHTLYRRHYLISLRQEEEMKKREAEGKKNSSMPTGNFDMDDLEELGDLM